VSFAVPQGHFATLLGPSGCGKTTLLKLIGGYLAPASGGIEVYGRTVEGLPPEMRNLGMVFQNYALFPHLNVQRNVAFGLEVRGVAKAAVREKVEAVLDLVGLTPDERRRYPRQLSGGQQQRVALARALAFDPPLLLLDEPFSSLDRQLRHQLRAELAAIHQQTRISTLMVTHDQEEALAVSQLVGVMRWGRLLQFGTPWELYFQPRTPFVARFLGEANLLEGRRLGLSSRALVLIRPEQLKLGGSLPARVSGLQFLGADMRVTLECDGLRLAMRCRAEADLTVGQTVFIEIPASGLWEIPEGDRP